jgi:hypothetical protein
MRIIGLSLAFVMALCAAKADAQDPGAPPTPAPIAPLDRTVTLEVQNSPLVRVIESINEQAGLGRSPCGTSPPARPSRRFWKARE